jgi:hypothetical protein
LPGHSARLRAAPRSEIGQIIVADVDRLRVAELVLPNTEQLTQLIRKPIPQSA